MRDSRQPALLLGSYGRGNLGDDAFLLAALELFKGRKLYINAADEGLLPQAVRGKVTTIATSGNKDLWQKIKVFRGIRHVVYCGGDLWVELYGDRFPRQSLYKMLIVNTVARLCGKKVHYLGCGIGALRGYSLFLARLSARLANSIVVREHRSAGVLALPKVQILPDLVTTLDIKPADIFRPANVPAPTKPSKAPGRAHLTSPGLRTAERKMSAGSSKFTVGISILYHLPDPEKNFPKLIDTLQEVVGKLPSSHYRIVLFPMLASPAESHDDVWASGELQKALPKADISISSARDVRGYVAELRDVDVLIGARLHASIIAMLAGVPALGISYRPKVEQFFALCGLQRYCIDLTDLTPRRLEKTLYMMRTRRNAVRRDFHEARERITAEKEGYQNFAKANF